MSVLRLAIPSPLRRHFDYLAPIGVSNAELVGLQPGIRLRVPFGRREVTGYLLAVCEDSDIPLSSLKHALEILDEAPLIDPQLLHLCRWAADYYHHPHGEVFGTLFPKRLREGKPQQPHGTLVWQLTTLGKGLPEAALPRSPRQAQAISLLMQKPVIENTEFRDNSISATVLRSLQDKKLIESHIISERLQSIRINEGLTLNSEQYAALKAVSGTKQGFSCHLLEGVTGSGNVQTLPEGGGT